MYIHTDKAWQHPHPSPGQHTHNTLQASSSMHTTAQSHTRTQAQGRRRQYRSAVPAGGIARVSGRQLASDVEGNFTTRARFTHELNHFTVGGVHHIEAVDVGDLVANLQPPIEVGCPSRHNCAYGGLDMETREIVMLCITSLTFYSTQKSSVSLSSSSFHLLHPLPLPSPSDSLMHSPPLTCSYPPLAPTHL